MEPPLRRSRNENKDSVTRIMSPLRLRVMRRVFPALVAVLALFTAACGGDAGTTTTTVATTTSSTTSPSTSATQVTTTTTTPNTTTTAPTTTTTEAVGSTTLAGQPIDFGPAEGDVLMVIGVRHDDVLNLRAAPGANQPIIDEIPATFADLIALGNTRELPSSFWIEVDFDGTEGWVHMGYIGYEGDVTDATAAVIDELGERPVESTMQGLAERVAEVFASEADPESDIVQVTTVTTGDLAEVTYDIVGLGDDAVRGVRIHVFAEEVDAGFSLRTVETTIICGRGVDPDAACV